MIFVESYKDFLGKGNHHIVSIIDNDWILKSPYSAVGKNSLKKYELENFKNHINIMKKYQQIFPKVKLLDKCRAAI